MMARLLLNVIFDYRPLILCIQFSSVQSLSHVRLFATPWTAADQASLSINSSRSLHILCPLSRWCHPTISSSVVPFSSCLQSFPASGSFQTSQFFTIRWPKYWSSSFSISPSNEYSGLTSFRIGWISLLSKGLSRVFSNNTGPKHPYFGSQLSLLSNSHIHTWLLEKP